MTLPDSERQQETRTEPGGGVRQSTTKVRKAVRDQRVKAKANGGVQEKSGGHARRGSQEAKPMEGSASKTEAPGKRRGAPVRGTDGLLESGSFFVISQLIRLFHQCADFHQVAVLFMIVKAVPYRKNIRQFKTLVIDWYFHQPARRHIEQSTYP